MRYLFILFFCCASVFAVTHPADSPEERYWQVDYQDYGTLGFYFSVVFEPHEGLVDRSQMTRLLFIADSAGGFNTFSSEWFMPAMGFWMPTPIIPDINDLIHQDKLEHIMDAFFLSEITSVHMDIFPWSLITNPVYWQDSDGDGVGNIQDVDSDNDLWLDWLERDLGSNPLDSNDVPLDSDSDGWADSVELIYGSDPANPYFTPPFGFNPNPYGPSMSSSGYSGLTSYSLGADPEGGSSPSPVVIQTSVPIFDYITLLSTALGVIIGSVLGFALAIFIIRRGIVSIKGYIR